jgi:dolichol kinase
MAILDKKSIVRTIYLYLFALLGLILVIIGGVKLIDLGLKVFIFKEADILIPPYPPVPPVADLNPSEKATKEKIEKLEVTEEEKKSLQSWLIEYQRWQEFQSKIDYVKSERQKTAANSLAFIIVGLPIYLYHWSLIRKEKNSQDS